MLRGIRIGELDQLWTVQSSTSTNNTITNEPQLTWSNLKTKCFKELVPKSAERFEGQQQVAHKVTQLFGRYDNSITETMRLVSPDDETFYISGIEKKYREGYMIITCEKRDNG